VVCAELHEAQPLVLDKFALVPTCRGGDHGRRAEYACVDAARGWRRRRPAARPRPRDHQHRRAGESPRADSARGCERTRSLASVKQTKSVTSFVVCALRVGVASSRDAARQAAAFRATPACCPCPPCGTMRRPPNMRATRPSAVSMFGGGRVARNGTALPWRGARSFASQFRNPTRILTAARRQDVDAARGDSATRQSSATSGRRPTVARTRLARCTSSKRPAGRLQRDERLVRRASRASARATRTKGSEVATGNFACAAAAMRAGALGPRQVLPPPDSRVVAGTEVVRVRDVDVVEDADKP